MSTISSVSLILKKNYKATKNIQILFIYFECKLAEFKKNYYPYLGKETWHWRCRICFPLLALNRLRLKKLT